MTLTFQYSQRTGLSVTQCDPCLPVFTVYWTECDQCDPYLPVLTVYWTVSDPYLPVLTVYWTECDPAILYLVSDPVLRQQTVPTAQQWLGVRLSMCLEICMPLVSTHNIWMVPVGTALYRGMLQ